MSPPGWRSGTAVARMSARDPSPRHHGNNPEKLANLVKLNTYHVTLFAKFLKKLESTPDGDGSLLDHSMILYGSGMSESDTHSRLNIPVAIMGGGLAERQPSHPGAEGDPAGEPDAGLRQQVRMRDGQVRDQHRQG